MVDPRLLPEGTDWVVEKDSVVRGQPGRVVARCLQYEVREGREAVMPEVRLGINLAECEDLSVLHGGVMMRAFSKGSRLVTLPPAVIRELPDG